MAAMKRVTTEEFVRKLKEAGCNEMEGYVDSDSQSIFLVSPDGIPFQVPNIDEDGYLEGWQIDEIINNVGIKVNWMRNED